MNDNIQFHVVMSQKIARFVYSIFCCSSRPQYLIFITQVLTNMLQVCPGDPGKHIIILLLLSVLINSFSVWDIGEFSNDSFRWQKMSIFSVILNVGVFHWGIRDWFSVYMCVEKSLVLSCDVDFELFSFSDDEFKGQMWFKESFRCFCCKQSAFLCTCPYMVISVVGGAWGLRARFHHLFMVKAKWVKTFVSRFFVLKCFLYRLHVWVGWGVSHMIQDLIHTFKASHCILSNTLIWVSLARVIMGRSEICIPRRWFQGKVTQKNTQMLTDVCVYWKPVSGCVRLCRSGHAKAFHFIPKPCEHLVEKNTFLFPFKHTHAPTLEHSTTELLHIYLLHFCSTHKHPNSC